MSSTTQEPREVILAPVSEKSYGLIEENRYTFRVATGAHKTQVRQAIEELFNVRVTTSRSSRSPPSRKRRGARPGCPPGLQEGHRQLRDGDTIALFEGVH